jgi:hypothetical protein
MKLSNYYKKTPEAVKYWGDVMLFAAPLLSGAVMTAPFDETVKLWVVFGLNIVLVIGKILTKFVGDEPIDA